MRNSGSDRFLHKSTLQPVKITVPGSKSETNRLLLLQALYPAITVQNASDSDDAMALRTALVNPFETIDIGHAGTAMRFLTAYFATQPGKQVILTGSARMQQRPIGILVNALRELGADISYCKNEGYPPIRITGKSLPGTSVAVPAGVSSQFLSALLLIAPALPNGLQLKPIGTPTSAPYLQMTVGLLQRCGIHVDIAPEHISVRHHAAVPRQVQTVDSDWSSASYFFGFVAASPVGTVLTLESFSPDSLQGDRAVVTHFRKFGVESTFNGNQLEILKTAAHEPAFEANLNDNPDLSQTLAVTCAALGMKCALSGLHTLVIKETNRLAALQSELKKVGVNVTITSDSLRFEAPAKLVENPTIETFDDHRMAMSFAILALVMPVTIRNAKVVTKSYPQFWDTLEIAGIHSELIF